MHHRNTDTYGISVDWPTDGLVSGRVSQQKKMMKRVAVEIATACAAVNSKRSKTRLWTGKGWDTRARKLEHAKSECVHACRSLDRTVLMWLLWSSWLWRRRRPLFRSTSNKCASANGWLEDRLRAPRMRMLHTWCWPMQCLSMRSEHAGGSHTPKCRLDSTLAKGIQMSNIQVRLRNVALNWADAHQADELVRILSRVDARVHTTAGDDCCCFQCKWSSWYKCYQVSSWKGNVDKLDGDHSRWYTLTILSRGVHKVQLFYTEIIWLAMVVWASILGNGQPNHQKGYKTRVSTYGNDGGGEQTNVDASHQSIWSTRRPQPSECEIMIGLIQYIEQIEGERASGRGWEIHRKKCQR